MGQMAGQKSRGNGEGNIRQKSDGRWEARITIGYTDEGKQNPNCNIKLNQSS